MKKNDIIRCFIDSHGAEGEGVAHIDNMPIFIPFAVKDDIADIRILKVKNGYAFGKIEKIISPSPYRIKPYCPAFGKCGGCRLMHIDYDFQKKIKTDMVHNTLKHIGGFSDIKVEPCIGMENPYRYRNKMIFPIDYNKDLELCFGFYRSKSHSIIPLSDCIIGVSESSAIAHAIIRHMTDYSIKAYDEETCKGTIRRIFIRKGYETGEVMAVIISSEPKIKKREALVSSILKACPAVISIILNVNSSKGNAMLGDKNIVLFGSDHITDKLDGIGFEISPHSFFQINPQQTKILYQKVIELAQIKNTDLVFDIYCGIGTISLLAAKYAKKVIGIEIVSTAIDDAIQNAIRNNIQNVEFICDSADKKVPSLIKRGLRPDIVILDPPRKGSDENTLLAIAKAEPKRIVYVSCNPATLARDLVLLCDNGFEINKIIPVDMFAHTGHVECVVLITRVKE